MGKLPAKSEAKKKGEETVGSLPTITVRSFFAHETVGYCSRFGAQPFRGKHTSDFREQNCPRSRRYRFVQVLSQKSEANWPRTRGQPFRGQDASDFVSSLHPASGALFRPWKFASEAGSKSSGARLSQARRQRCHNIGPTSLRSCWQSACLGLEMFRLTFGASCFEILWRGFLGKTSRVRRQMITIWSIFACGALVHGLGICCL